MYGLPKLGMGVDSQTEIIERQGKVRSLENSCKYDTVSALVVSNPATLEKSPSLYVKYFKGWLTA
jgi:hypothetical protein